MTFIGKTNNVDEQMANYIRNYPIPNNKEDVFEFMILASSNIDEGLIRGEKYSTSIGDTKGKKLINSAWYSKFQQVYNKAQLSFGKDRDFARIEEIYNKKIAQIEKGREEKKKKDKFKAKIAGKVAGRAIAEVIDEILPF